MKIRDLIQVPEVRTVIQMADIEDPALRDFLTESFVITDEVERVLLSFFSDVMNKQGKGYFIEGNFGSGKSHLLSVLSLLLNYSDSWNPILEQKEPESRLVRLSEDISNSNYLVINLSLVEHSNREYLEDIVVSEIARLLNEENKGDFDFSRREDFIEQMSGVIKEENPDKLENFLQEEGITENELFAPDNLFLLEQLIAELNLPYRLNYNRQQVFDQLAEVIAFQDYQGIAILIDELSEFLRSKPDGRRFNEDIRFLQFLGEFSRRLPCWVVATLQEEIERTGETTPEAFNKIKDRYPTRFHLTGEHVKELISQRLIHLREDGIQEVNGIFNDYRDCFPEITFNRGDFLNLYPVHPLAIDLLDNLKPLFSQHRGIIDFIHYRLKGDPARNIPGMMDEPAASLLTADQIFDHFTDRIREMMETSPYYEKVYKYYRQEIDSLLAEEERKAGLRLVKLLILFTISPIDKKYTVREMANMLFIRVTDLEPEVNYEYINHILQRLHRHGAYLVKEEGETEFDNRYYIDLEADVNLIIRRRTEYIASNLFQDDKRLFTRLGRGVDEKFLPLKKLFQNPRSKRTITWQNTERKGFVYFIPLTEITIEDIKRTASSLTEKEADFMLIIGHALKVEEQEEYLERVLLPELSDREQESFLFWLPGELEDRGFLTEALSRLLLLEEYEGDSSSTGQKVKQRLHQLIAEDSNRVNKLFRDAYFQGRVINGFQEQVINLDRAGFLPFSRFLESVVARLLEEKYPDHKKVAPYQRVLTTDQIEALLDKFMEPGEINDLKEVKGRVLNVIDAFLKPMGLINKQKAGVRLQVNPDKNPLLKRLFSCLEEEKTPLSRVYWQMRKGTYGLSHKQFKLLIYALLYSGYLTAYSERQKISLKRLNARNFNRIKYLGYGEIIGEDFQQILKDCSLLPPRMKKQPFSLPLQQRIWDHLCEEKRELVSGVDRLQTRIKELNRQGIIEYFPVTKMLGHLEKVENLLAEIKVSYSSEEGLERFASGYRSQPHIDSYLERMEKMDEFIDGKLRSYRQIKDYLEHSKLIIPDEEKYDELRNFKNSLLASLKDEAVIFEKGFFQELEAGFRDFRDRYLETYQKEHSRQLAADRFRPYQKLKNSKGYRVLSSLSGIKMISVRDDLVKVDRMISRALRKKCARLSVRRLKETPVCSCGFQLGEVVELPSLKDIRQTIKAGVIQYLKALKKPEHRDKIESYLDNMEAVGKKRFARPVRELLKLTPDQDLYVELDKLLNRNLISRLNQALSGDISLVERDLDNLYENLVGRSFSPDQIRQIFNEWLEGTGGLTDKTYIQVLAGDSPAENENRGIVEAYIDRYYPELLPLLDRLGLSSFSLLLAVFTWKEGYNLDITPEELLSELDPERGGEIAVHLEEDSSYRISIRELTEELFTDPGRTEVKEEISRQLGQGISEQLMDRLSPDSPADVFKAVKGEEILALNLQKFLRYFVHLLENDRPEDHDKYLQNLAEIKGNLTEGFLAEEKEEIMEFINSYLNLEKSLHFLERENRISTCKQWQSVYRDHLSGLEYNYYRLQQLAESLDIEEMVPLSLKYKRITRLLTGYQKRFSDFYDDMQFMVAEDNNQGQGLNIGDLIIDKYPELLKNLGTDRGCCLLLDGMRWDIWKLIRQRITESLPLRLVKEGSLFALSPTSTERQLEALRETGFEGAILEPGDVDFNTLPGRNCNQIIKFSYPDDKVHTSKEKYTDFIEEISFQTENRLLPFLEKIPNGTAILVFADHGFKINHQFRQAEKYESPRYLHGGNSFHEIIVPWGFMYRP